LDHSDVNIALSKFEEVQEDH